MRRNNYLYREKKTIEQKMKMRVDLARVPEMENSLHELKQSFKKFQKKILVEAARVIYKYQSDCTYCVSGNPRLLDDREFESWVENFDPQDRRTRMPPWKVISAVEKDRYTDYKEVIIRLTKERELLIKNGVTDSFLWSLLTSKTHSAKVKAVEQEIAKALLCKKEFDNNVIHAIKIFGEFYFEFSRCSSRIDDIEKFLQRAREKRDAINQFERENGNALAKAASVDKKTRERATKIKFVIPIHDLCPYCNKPLSGEDIHLDHIYPVSKGGLSIIENLVYCCSICNSKKSNKGLFQFSKDTGLDYEKIISSA
jgi:5-methylcytosine-specific restriction endonuclease McrA/adenosyl cobinamide kinase/adenosyl cobinamide phosphate guanylyltransferase